MRPIALLLPGLGLVLALSAGCGTPRAGNGGAPAGGIPAAAAGIETNGLSTNAAIALEQRWGIRVDSLRRSAHGHILDFRYRVLDPDKAGLLADAGRRAYLINEATGERLQVPNMPKVGALRSTAVQLERDRIYLILFANPGSKVASGDRVTLLVDECKIEHLVVE